MNPWVLTFNDFDPKQIGLREALCTLGNGYFATRGALEESLADAYHYPGTYLAGGYNKLTTTVAGRTLINEDLVNLPNWLVVSFYPIDSQPNWLLSAKRLEHKLELNMYQGLLKRSSHIIDARGRETIITSRRIVHMANPHLAAIEYIIKPLNWSGEINLISSLDGSVTNQGVARYSQLNGKHLEVLNRIQINNDTLGLCVQTNQSHLQVALTARTQIFATYNCLAIPAKIQTTQETISQIFNFTISAGQPITIEKILTLYSSRDFAISECQIEAKTASQETGRFKNLLKTHRLAWKHVWQHCDINLTSKSPESTIVRLHTFHLLQTLSPHIIGLDVGAPARGLHGEAYRGHIFWDELFILPFLTHYLPAVSRSLLLYRYRRLNAARRLAKQAGYAGAMFPWQSASNGEEVSQRWHLNPRSNTWGPDYSFLQRHVNAAIAYNIWHYYQHTLDEEFLSGYGAEMLLEIARFWASLATFNTTIQRYEIKGVMGPDEYHECYPNANKPGLNNNAYTNVMAVWVIERALQTIKSLPSRRVIELKELLKLSDQELASWEPITQRMFIPFHAGIISQFQGYERLKEFAWQAYQTQYGNIERLDRILKNEKDSPDHYKIAKQADVVMLFYLLPTMELQRLFKQLGYTLTEKMIQHTIEYYLQRTSHGSTLSKVIFAKVLTPYKPELARELYLQALYSDLHDTQQGTTREGIHLGVMASTII
ncbi:MAG: Trehalose 6-phosphate phosphorylase [Gammaproteobacteria bacterium]|jgi:trehalose/maltose hydrolase-like predicted phosphorylase|nr:Trehalose 6-phosphate phosphorylase [Gammaproteobacteria bacterium]